MATKKSKGTTKSSKQSKSKPRIANMPYAEAKALVQTLNIRTSGEYKTWHDANNPARLPKYPNRGYAKDWENWMEFLGVGDDAITFRSKIEWRAYSEAIQYAHSLRLMTSVEWDKHVRSVGIPHDVPARPEIHYREDWVSWDHWLGRTASAVAEVHKKVVRPNTYYYVARVVDMEYPVNIFIFGTDSTGAQSLLEREAKGTLQIVALFAYDEQANADILNILQHLTQDWRGDHKLKIVPNIHEVTWQLSYFMDDINIQELRDTRNRKLLAAANDRMHNIHKEQRAARMQAEPALPTSASTVTQYESYDGDSDIADVLNMLS